MAVLSVSSADSTDEEILWARYGSAPLIVTLILPIVIGVIVLLKCVLNHCCVRKNTTKEELYGVEGRMTILPQSETPFLPSNTHPNTPSLRPSPPASLSASVEESSLEKGYNNKLEDHQSSENASNNNTLPEKFGSLGALPTKDKNVDNCSDNFKKVTTVPVVSNPPSSSSKDWDKSKQCAVNAATSGVVVSRRSSGGIPSPNNFHEVLRQTFSDSHKRSSTLNRELPDIPFNAEPHNQRSCSVGSQDGTSELYATVEEVPNLVPHGEVSSKNQYARVSKPNFRDKTNGVIFNASSSVRNEPTPSSDSETYASAAQNSSAHAYAKLIRQTLEHPYAKVKSKFRGTNDEETDTDNYDTPQPYGRTGQLGPNSAGPSHLLQDSSNGTTSSAGSADNSNPTSSMNGGPIPPRRGVRWRRANSQPQNQIEYNHDEAIHFSGDSQDSRGYSSISVREPLSKIRNQPSTIRNDSFYSTVSDDSEEMYAAIEETHAYTKLSRRRSDDPRLWLGNAEGVNQLVSPIPERREANSPLPPVPAISPPIIPSGTASSGQVSNVQLQSATLPLYAQVNKKRKGKKALMVSLSNEPSSSHSNRRQESVEEKIVKGASEAEGATVSHSKSRHSSYYVTEERIGNETRRWSKADISYSDFEVVRESLSASSSSSTQVVPSKNVSNPSTSNSVTNFHVGGPTSSGASATNVQKSELLDEDNYNIIPEKHPGKVNASTSVLYSSGNYQEVEPISNPYHEIQTSQPPSLNHYQEISDRVSSNYPDQELYHEIVDKPQSISQDEEDEEEDQFYEKVKPLKKEEENEEDPDRRHKYETIRKKQDERKASAVVSSDAEDDDDDDDDQEDGQDDHYERVKYPPYERLKESRDDLRSYAGASDDADSEGNLYEAIGYSKIRPTTKGNIEKTEKGNIGSEGKDQNPSEAKECEVPRQKSSSPPNVDALYARVDKSKKKPKRKGKKETDDSKTESTSPAPISTEVEADNGDNSIEYI